jgi:hypothetical protein
VPAACKRESSLATDELLDCSLLELEEVLELLLTELLEFVVELSLLEEPQPAMATLAARARDKGCQ